MHSELEMMLRLEVKAAFWKFMLRDGSYPSVGINGFIGSVGFI